jgi:hypothetical protein
VTVHNLRHYKYNSQIYGQMSRLYKRKSNFIADKSSNSFIILLVRAALLCECRALRQASVTKTDGIRRWAEERLRFIGSPDRVSRNVSCSTENYSRNKTIPCDRNKWTNHVRILGGNIISNTDCYLYLLEHHAMKGCTQ